MADEKADEKDNKKAGDRGNRRRRTEIGDTGNRAVGKPLHKSQEQDLRGLRQALEGQRKDERWAGEEVDEGKERGLEANIGADGGVGLESDLAIVSGLKEAGKDWKKTKSGHNGRITGVWEERKRKEREKLVDKRGKKKKMKEKGLLDEEEFIRDLEKSQRRSGVGAKEEGGAYGAGLSDVELKAKKDAWTSTKIEEWEDGIFTLAEKKELACRMFAQGYGNREVAGNLRISIGKAGSFRKWYEMKLGEAVGKNPGLLNQALDNTVRTLRELDVVRIQAWEEYKKSDTHAAKQKYLGLIMKAQNERAKLFGLFGVKQDYFVHIQNIQTVSVALYSFMQKELCAGDRGKLERYLTGEMAAFLDSGGTAAIGGIGMGGDGGRVDGERLPDGSRKKSNRTMGGDGDALWNYDDSGEIEAIEAEISRELKGDISLGGMSDMAANLETDSDFSDVGMGGERGAKGGKGRRKKGSEGDREISELMAMEKVRRELENELEIKDVPDVNVAPDEIVVVSRSAKTWMQNQEEELKRLAGGDSGLGIVVGDDSDENVAALGRLYQEKKKARKKKNTVTRKDLKKADQEKWDTESRLLGEEDD